MRSLTLRFSHCSSKAMLTWHANAWQTSSLTPTVIGNTSGPGVTGTSTGDPVRLQDASGTKGAEAWRNTLGLLVFFDHLMTDGRQAAQVHSNGPQVCLEKMLVAVFNDHTHESLGVIAVRF